jgi:hypothetical protein
METKKMNTNLDNYFKALTTECETHIGDKDEFGIWYGMYGTNEGENLLDPVLVKQFELGPDDISFLNENKVVIVSETQSGEFERDMFKTVEEAKQEFEDINKELKEFYDEDDLDSFSEEEEDYLEEGLYHE